uniref:Endonuclease/exonuclease/phosphatase domain-containing protein n=1 Tax=Fibrocapsa japonica TaxID=94617 RepID=A0A7S2V1N9_9STRA|mmetsp:Transcript_21600/g.31334  ORF Transcript_21600/g.31334 Transcript_21600/m.31334 type:complete len:586 (+) Transcript_21600:76-1833(+)
MLLWRISLSYLFFQQVHAMKNYHGAFIPLGHTPFSWHSKAQVLLPCGHTPFSWGILSEAPRDTGHGLSNMASSTALMQAEAGGKAEPSSGEPGFPVLIEAGQALRPPPTAPLDCERTLSVLSYNVLLPNSADGWWIYKYYKHHVPEEHRTWEYRQQLLKVQLLGSEADVICLQETSPKSFESDFAFLREAGYESIQHNKGRLRCATFWRADKLEQVLCTHSDRVLLHAFQVKSRDGESAAPPASDDGEKEDAIAAGPDFANMVFVANCHLSAGPDIPRRLRQVHEALAGVKKGVNKMVKEANSKLQALPKQKKGTKKGGGRQAVPAPDLGQMRVVVCGDMNCPADAVVSRFLTQGSLGPSDRDEKYPDMAFTSKVKEHPFKDFRDAYEEVYRGLGHLSRPPTMIVPEVESKFFIPDDHELSPSPAFVEAIQNMFSKFSSDGGETMNEQDIEKWLVAINRQVGRGSEFRSARDCRERAGRPFLSCDELLSVYMSELGEGKFWGVYHDVVACGVWPREDHTPPFEGVFDYMYYTASTLDLLASRAPLSEGQLHQARSGDILPNSWHPSDHIPVASLFYLGSQHNERV